MKTEKLNLEFPNRAANIVAKIFGCANCAPNLTGFIDDGDDTAQPYHEGGDFHGIHSSPTKLFGQVEKIMS